MRYPQYACTLIAVKDLKVTEQFYHDLFGLDVVMDLGWNVTLSDHLAIQLNFTTLLGIPDDSLVERSHNMELYFDTPDFDDFVALLDSRSDIEYVSRAETYPWLQRGLRIYDPDHHIIEIGEAMPAVAQRVYRECGTLEETAQRLQHPIEAVREWCSPDFKF